MSIKSDNWIRRMAEETQMIEPFEAGQVRYSGDDALSLTALQATATMFAVLMSLRCLPMCTPKL